MILDLLPLVGGDLIAGAKHPARHSRQRLMIIAQIKDLINNGNPRRHGPPQQRPHSVTLHQRRGPIPPTSRQLIHHRRLAVGLPATGPRLTIAGAVTAAHIAHIAHIAHRHRCASRRRRRPLTAIAHTIGRHRCASRRRRRPLTAIAHTIGMFIRLVLTHGRAAVRHVVRLILRRRAQEIRGDRHTVLRGAADNPHRHRNHRHQPQKRRHQVRAGVPRRSTGRLHPHSSSRVESRLRSHRRVHVQVGGPDSLGTHAFMYRLRPLTAPTYQPSRLEPSLE